MDTLVTATDAELLFLDRVAGSFGGLEITLAASMRVFHATLLRARLNPALNM